MFFQIIIFGLITGLLYATFALGFSLVYNITRIFHIAYAFLCASAPYLLYYFFDISGLALWISIIISVCITMILSILIEFIVYKPLIKRNSSLNVLLVGSIGVLIVGINLLAVIFGNDRLILTNEVSSLMDLKFVKVTSIQFIQFFTSVTVILFFILLVNNTRAGVIFRAMRDNMTLCNINGINTGLFRYFIFLLSGFFAATGGILIAFDTGFEPYMGMSIFLNVVVASIIGGLGRFYTPVIGGIILGLIQSIVLWKFSNNWQDAITFSVLIIFLIVRPNGLYGVKERMV